MWTAGFLGDRRTRLRALAIALALAAAVGLGIAGLWHVAGGVRVDEVFDDADRQLMWPPESSVRAVDLAAQTGELAPGVLWYPPTRGECAGFADAMLEQRFSLPDDGTCLGFPNEAGRMDVVRWRYSVEGLRFDGAVSRTGGALRVTGAALQRRSPDVLHGANVVHDIAGRIFRELPGPGMVLEVLGEDHGFLYGRQNPRAKEWTDNWLDGLTWFYDGRSVGFLSPKPPHKRREAQLRGWLRPWLDPNGYELWSMRGLLRLVDPPRSSAGAMDVLLPAFWPTPGVLRLSPETGRVPKFAGLRPEYELPDSALCLGFPAEAGQFDVVRCRYRTEGWTFHLATTDCQAALLVSGDDLEGDGELSAHLVLERIFVVDVAGSLKLLGYHGDRAFGERGSAGSRFLAGPLDGLGSLLWWHNDRTVGFSYWRPTMLDCRDGGTNEWLPRPAPP